MKKFIVFCLMAFMVCSCSCSCSTNTSSNEEYTGYFTTNQIVPCANSVGNLDQMCSYCSVQNMNGMISMAQLGIATLLPEFAFLYVVDYGYTNSKVKIIRDGADGEMNGCIVYVKTDHLKRLCTEYKN